MGPFYPRLQIPTLGATDTVRERSKSMGMEEKKEEGDSKKEFSRKEDGPINVVFKVDMHCEDCAQKVRRSVKKFKGVEAVASEVSGNKLTVIGKVNPFELRGKLETKMHRKVELVFPVVAAEKEKEIAKAEGNEGRNDQSPEQSTKKEKSDKKTAAAATSGQDTVKTAAAAAAAVAATLEAMKMEYYSHCYSNYPYGLEMAHAPPLFSEDPNECSIM